MARKKASSKSPTGEPSAEKIAKDPKAAAQAVNTRRIAERAIATPLSAPRASAFDVAAEQRRAKAEIEQQKLLKENYDSFMADVAERRKAKRGAGAPHGETGEVATKEPTKESPGDIYVVENPTGEYIEFTMRGNTAYLKPGDNEFDDHVFPGVSGKDVAEAAATQHGFVRGLHTYRKADKHKVGVTSREQTVVDPDTQPAAIAYPETHYEQIKDVQNPSADERAQPVRFPGRDPKDPLLPAVKATKRAWIAEHHKTDSDDKSTKRGGRSKRVTGAKK